MMYISRKGEKAMRSFWQGTTACMCALALLAASCTYAATVVVTPTNMQGWVADVWLGTDPDATAPSYGFSNLIAPPYTSAFQMNSGTSVEGGGPNEGATNEVWLGTNQFNGVKITDVTSLRYSTWTEWSGNLWVSTVRNPIELQIAIKGDGIPAGAPGDDPSLWMYAIYRPWGDEGPDWNRDLFQTWQTWEPVNNAHEWVLAYHKVPAPLDPDDPANYRFTWDEICTMYPDAKILDPKSWDDCTAGDPWMAPYPEQPYQAATLTGTSVNFQVGARRTWDWMMGGAWWLWSYDFVGYMDMFTFAYLDGENEVSTTFDFESNQAPPPTGGISNAGAQTAIMAELEKKSFVVLWGKVLNNLFTSTEFLIDDGSGKYIKVKCVGHDVYPDDIVRVWGTYHYNFMEDIGPPIIIQSTLYTDPAHVVVMSSP